MSERITTEQKNKALEVYAETGYQKSAAQAIRLSTKTIQREMGRDKVFKEDMEEAKLGYNARLLKTLRDRIDEGKSKLSDALLMFEVKKHMPEYREKFEHKVDTTVTIISGVPRPK